MKILLKFYRNYFIGKFSQNFLRRYTSFFQNRYFLKFFQCLAANKMVKISPKVKTFLVFLSSLLSTSFCQGRYYELSKIFCTFVIKMGAVTLIRKCSVKSFSLTKGSRVNLEEIPALFIRTSKPDPFSVEVTVSASFTMLASSRTSVNKKRVRPFKSSFQN